MNWPRPRFLSYNVCGASCTVYQGSKPAWRDKVVGAVDACDADLLMLQELCHGQWTLLRNALGNRTSGGPPYDSVWSAALGSAPGCQAVLLERPGRERARLTLSVEARHKQLSTGQAVDPEEARAWVEAIVGPAWLPHF
ncbi:hypothetical protein [Streptomyces sp. NPDC059247]|uniref:hypothetical protein n=1 Tax=Streptomyces sp. NPDC059247 TaxID=3346790 RepID=UPI003673985A